MKQILTCISFPLLFLACASSKNYLERSDPQKALQDAVKKLNKDASDENATQAVPLLYKTITDNKLRKIESLRRAGDLSRWEKIIDEYDGLQNAYDVIVNSAAAFRLVTPASYATQLMEAREEGAATYYAQGMRFYHETGRNAAKRAFINFKNADKLSPGFRDAAEKSEDAFQNALVNVLINPVQDNSYFYSNGWGTTGNTFTNDYFQRTLVRELSNTSTYFPARFVTEWDAQTKNIRPDWQVDLRLTEMDIPFPFTKSYTRNVNAQVQVGTDTTGQPVYNTVYATLSITRMSFTARAEMEVNIFETDTRRSISARRFRDSYRWEQERASYSGDNRALSANDWQMINNNNIAPRREDILRELYQRIYPQVRNNVRDAVDW